MAATSPFHCSKCNSSYPGLEGEFTLSSQQPLTFENKNRNGAVRRFTLIEDASGVPKLQLEFPQINDPFIRLLKGQGIDLQLSARSYVTKTLSELHCFMGLLTHHNDFLDSEICQLGGRIEEVTTPSHKMNYPDVKSKFSPVKGKQWGDISVINGRVVREMAFKNQNSDAKVSSFCLQSLGGYVRLTICFDDPSLKIYLKSLGLAATSYFFYTTQGAKELNILLSAIINHNDLSQIEVDLLKAAARESTETMKEIDPATANTWFTKEYSGRIDPPIYPGPPAEFVYERRIGGQALFTQDVFATERRGSTIKEFAILKMGDLFLVGFRMHFLPRYPYFREFLEFYGIILDEASYNSGVYETSDKALCNTLFEIINKRYSIPGGIKNTQF